MFDPFNDDYLLVLNFISYDMQDMQDSVTKFLSDS